MHTAGSSFHLALVTGEAVLVLCWCNAFASILLLLVMTLMS